MRLTKEQLQSVITKLQGSLNRGDNEAKENRETMRHLKIEQITNKLFKTGSDTIHLTKWCELNTHI